MLIPLSLFSSIKQLIKQLVSSQLHIQRRFLRRVQEGISPNFQMGNHTSELAPTKQAVLL